MNDKYVLDVKDLKKNYITHTANDEEIVYSILKGISFQVEKGEFISIMGPSGCGKTTLLKTIGMLLRPSEGKVFYNGKDTDKIYGDELAKIRRTELAFIFQDFYLMDSLTVKENIVLPLILDERDAKESEQIALEVARSVKIDPLLEKKPFELSGGERQRTAICRAVAADPELILADEPTGNLDSNSSRQVIETLSHISKDMKKTVLMVTHDPKMASYSDKVLFLKDGIILNTMKKEESNEIFYQKILEQMAKI